MSVYQTVLRRMAHNMRFIAITTAACCFLESHAASPEMVGRWSFDQAGSPYTESTGNASDFLLDMSTTPATNNLGVLGNAAGTRYSDPGPSTRLASYNTAVDRDSFGFSVWIRPTGVNEWDNLFGKEMQEVAGDDWQRMAWQVHALANDGSGNASLEFVVRGSNHAESDFFGAAVSVIKIPLWTDSASWIHVAGGYDSFTGELRLFVNGEESNVAGTPGADNSDGGALAIGTMMNGPDYVQFAAGADFDDFRFYDAPLSSGNVQEILQDPERIPAGASDFDGQVIAHWKLDETGSPYADSSGHGNALAYDIETTAPSTEAGVDGNALLLRYEDPGPSTRLYANDEDDHALQSDSFGFSFWCRPAWLLAGDNLLAKEMPPTNVTSRMAWQVQVGQNDGTGSAPVELTVRGSDREEGDFFGSVGSSVKLPLETNSSSWVHIAGGYDAVTGDLSIYIDGVVNTAADIPGATNSEGSWFSVGSVRNGLDFVAYAAMAAIDDIQLYSKPLNQYAVAYLGSHPGEQVGFDLTTHNFAPDGNASLSFQSIPDWNYRVEATTNLSAAFNPVLQVAASNDLSDVSITPSEIDAAIGAGPHQQNFFRVRALVPDITTSNPAPAEITAFLNDNNYVPQYHFSWQHANVGDPCGLIRYNNTYHGFTWDQGTSDDLLHWETQGWPFKFSSSEYGFWTGSVVVDKDNTSGFGSGAMVILYTMHHNDSTEAVGLAYSTDSVNFYEYAGNPVITNATPDFRDPDVFWDDQMERWVLLITRSDVKQIEFFYSNDLKNWHWMSNFSPGSSAGASEDIWETTSLIQIPIIGTAGQKKWVLQVGSGSNKVQYWVGDFDGATFTMDDETEWYLKYGSGLDGIVFANFETGYYGDIGWTTTGNAFDGGPYYLATLGHGYLGDHMASSHPSDSANDDWLTGTLTSSEFTISNNCINFLIGGGNHPNETCINLKIDGSVVRTATGNDSDLLVWQGWNVAEYIGQQATIEIVDNNGGNWGRIYVDHIIFSDVLFDTGREHANWVEYSPDFYAAKFVRDFDGMENVVKWMAWIGNWDYETSRPQPVNWGKGAETLIRKLELVSTPRGYELTQQPINNLQALRGREVRIPPTLINGTMDLTNFEDPANNTYELEMEFNLDGTADIFGLNLCADATSVSKIVLGYDRSSSQLFLDRSNSNDPGTGLLETSFVDLCKVPYAPKGDTLKLRIFVDQSSIEVFTDDGCQVLTAQIYQDTWNNRIELFSTDGDTTLRSARAWLLATIWPQ